MVFVECSQVGRQRRTTIYIISDISRPFTDTVIYIYLYLYLYSNISIYQPQPIATLQPTRFLKAMASQTWPRGGGYWFVKLELDAALWLKISRPRTAGQSWGPGFVWRKETFWSRPRPY